MHEGVDFSAAEGSEISAVASGLGDLVGRENRLWQFS